MKVIRKGLRVQPGEMRMAADRLPMICHDFSYLRLLLCDAAAQIEELTTKLSKKKKL